MASIGRGQFEEARKCFELGMGFGRDDCNPRLEAFNLFNLARLERLTKAPVEALNAADAAYALLSRIGAPEALAASALCKAIRASQAADRSGEAESLLACGRASMQSADLYAPFDLFSEAEALARVENLTALTADALACRTLLEERRKAGR